MRRVRPRFGVDTSAGDTWAKTRFASRRSTMTTSASVGFSVFTGVRLASMRDWTSPDIRPLGQFADRRRRHRKSRTRRPVPTPGRPPASSRRRCPELIHARRGGAHVGLGGDRLVGRWITGSGLGRVGVGRRRSGRVRIGRVRIGVVSGIGRVRIGRRRDRWCRDRSCRDRSWSARPSMWRRPRPARHRPLRPRASRARQP